MTALLAFLLAAPPLPAVETIPTPGGGIQPQAVRVADGTVRMIYFTGDPGGGDLSYVVSRDDGKTWSEPVPVNSIPGAATALGNIRGGQVAVAPDGTVAAIWNGSGKASGGDGQSALLYASLSPGARTFSRAVDLRGQTRFLDGGATVAFDGKGQLGVFWHAMTASGKDETDRAVWYATQDKATKKFSTPKKIAIGDLGACGCCSMKALGAAQGFTVLYRSATESIHRDTWRIAVDESGKATAKKIDPWNLNVCPMSTFALAESDGKTWMAWETEGKIRVSSGGAYTELSNSGKAKHPSLAAANGYVLCAYTEGMGWDKGGTLRWAILNKEAQIVKTSPPNAGKVPKWSLVTAFADKAGNFKVVD